MEEGCLRVPGNSRMGGYLCSDTDSIDVALRTFCGHHKDQLSFGSYHRSEYDLIRRFELGSPSFRLFAST
ncbi:hypothetical protein PIB30_047688 [Stylosanthes scabra]|uniref:Uncharacterized protein n=1 Tax=Stylosanthes scabra TaxID=79078 RepID=A0ABU6ZFJ4_9FABA|nr:hypothetical protein [Stylosanthes scabra]